MNNQVAQLIDANESPLAHQPMKEPAVAFLLAGDLIEDFLDSINVSLETFCSQMTGGWLFGYFEALKIAHVRSVLFCISARVSEVVRVNHRPTGATICFLPAPKVYQTYRKIRTVRRRALNLEGEFSASSAPQSPRRRFTLLKNSISTLGTYLSTPLGLLAQEIRREGCQAILCQEYEYGRFDTCVLLGKLLNIPVFATFQGRTWVHRGISDYLVRPLALKACKGLIISSQAEIKRVQADYAMPSSKIARVFSPVDISSWGDPDRNKIRTQLGISVKTKVVIWHGRVEIDKKGLDVLLAAWELICRKRPNRDLQLLLVGTGSDAEEFQQRIASMPLSNILWRNEYIQDRTLLRQYLAAADVYVLSSRWEGFPVAPIEAMACGLPVVAADAQGVADIFENGEADGGLVVPRENPQALAAALGQILDNQNLGEELGKRGYHRVEAHFSLKAIGQQLRSFLLNHEQ
ncbi:MAG: glycosyltransferase family 4 protein [Nostoc sp. CmiVER01]|uniref:glycosyltransferase family 4 protein n=1 Tax=Nostoc sp. CmiVER01 TaxID=3075384 RepID=UPI002AD3DD9B|nr:glycosyltransferase family 4 protein [Nostoc sp. CmiVER01]MDZ8121401.1 glycosyltransferase family 4 protein [Nostoc sp. CmiVER01]